MLQFGGHSAAAGFSIDANRIDELRDRLTKYCKEVVTAEEYIPVVAIDANYLLMISMSISLTAYQTLSLMGWPIARQSLLLWKLLCKILCSWAN